MPKSPSPAKVSFSALPVLSTGEQGKDSRIPWVVVRTSAVGCELFQLGWNEEAGIEELGCLSATVSRNNIIIYIQSPAWSQGSEQ